MCALPISAETSVSGATDSFSLGEFVPIPTSPFSLILSLSPIVPLFLVKNRKSDVLFAVVVKSSIAPDLICEPVIPLCLKSNLERLLVEVVELLIARVVSPVESAITNL